MLFRTGSGDSGLSGADRRRLRREGRREGRDDLPANDQLDDSSVVRQIIARRDFDVARIRGDAHDAIAAIDDEARDARTLLDQPIPAAKTETERRRAAVQQARVEEAEALLAQLDRRIRAVEDTCHERCRARDALAQIEVEEWAAGFRDSRGRRRSRVALGPSPVVPAHPAIGTAVFNPPTPQRRLRRVV